MRSTFLGGVSALALLLASAGPGLAQDANTANNNDQTAVAQDDGLSVEVGDVLLQFGVDVVAADENAVDDGGIVGDNGNALGAFTFGNDQVTGSSTQANVNAENNDAVAIDNSAAVDDGAWVGEGVAIGYDTDGNAAVGGDGLALATGGGSVADEGSAFQYGHTNTAATAEEYSAAANRGVAIATGGGEAVDEGSSLVYGNRNTTASADQRSAAVGGDGYALAINAEEAEGVFGENNAVSVADLEQEMTDIAVVVEPCECEEDGTGGESTLTTGHIFNNSFSDVTGVNEFYANTGIANQGTSVSVAARASFN